MRKVTLYTLKQEEVLTSNDHIAIGGSYQRPTPIRGSDEFILDAPLEVQALPIELYREYDTYKGDKEYLVAFDPKIRKLLHINEGKLKANLSQALEVNWIALEYRNKLLDENTELTVQNNKLLNECTKVKDELLVVHTTITNMSFWSRLVFLFTGKVKGL